jgi:putative transposase
MRYRRVFMPGASYFFTLITHRRARHFSEATNVDRWRRAVAKVQRTRPFIVEAEVVMLDHLHMIWSLPQADADYATRIRLVKTAFTKDLAGCDGGKGGESRASKGERDVWQRRYWGHRIRDERDIQAHLDYIHINPVKHGAVARPGDWRHSTFPVWLDHGVYDPHWGADGMPPLPDWAGRE